jgi:hypothetical protein
VSRYLGGPMGPVVVAGEARMALAGSISSIGGGSSSNLLSWTLLSPGNATVVGRDAYVMSEDGSAPAPIQLRVPAYVGRRGFFGVTGQVLAPTVAGRPLSYGVLNLIPRNVAFSGDATNYRIYFGTNNAELGAISIGRINLTLEDVGAPVQPYGQILPYTDPPTCGSWTSPKCPCALSYGISIQVKLMPIGGTYYALIIVNTMQTSFALGQMIGVDMWVSGFVVTQCSSVTNTVLPPVVQRTEVVMGATTVTPTISIAGGAASFAVTIVVSATGTVTSCEARVTPATAINNQGAGWHAFCTAQATTFS